MSGNPDVLTPQRRGTPENLANIKESVTEIAQTERERLRVAYEQGRVGVQDAQARFEDYVRERPLRSLLFAAGAGAALGYLLGRRR